MKASFQTFQIFLCLPFILLEIIVLKSYLSLQDREILVSKLSNVTQILIKNELKLWVSFHKTSDLHQMLVTQWGQTLMKKIASRWSS